MPALSMRKISLPASGISLFRSSQLQAQPVPAEIDIPSDDAFSVIVQLADFRQHKLWRNGRLVHREGHRRGEMAITDLREQWRCQHLSGFDNLRFHLPRATLQQLDQESGRRSGEFKTVQGVNDAVVFHLAQASQLALDAQGGESLLGETIVLALHAHLCNVYGKSGGAPETGALAAWQAARVRDYIEANLMRRLTLGEIAGQCGLSRAHFARAFKSAFGESAHAWVQRRRIERSRQLLAHGGRSISEVALECGFVDQSHFSRVFKRVLGTTPAAWLRAQARS